MSADRIYLDHAAATPMHPDARARMLELIERPLANPSSAHAEGRYFKDALEDARTRVARAFGCRPREIVFTGNATEAARVAIHGLVAAAGAGPRGVVSALEHPSVIETARTLAAQGRLDLDEVRPSARGGVDAAALAALTDGATFAALMLASHETGVAQPVRELAEALQGADVSVVCDASLGPGRLPCRRDDLGADVAIFAGHLFGGAPGAAILYVRRGSRIDPPFGGGLQEERLRPGVESVAAWSATSVAFEAALAETEARSARYRRLEHAFFEALGPDTGYDVVGGDAERAPGVFTLELAGVEGEAAMINLDLEGVAVATGSTCALGSADPSPGLLAMGFTRARAASTLRFSIGEDIDADNVQHAARITRDVLSRLRSLGRR